MNARCSRNNWSAKARATTFASWKTNKEILMKNTYRVLTLVIGLVAVLALGQILIGQAPAQAPGGGAPPAGTPGQGPGRGGGAGRGGAPAVPAGPIVRSPDGKPDMTGYWMSATKTNI